MPVPDNSNLKGNPQDRPTHPNTSYGQSNYLRQRVSPLFSQSREEVFGSCLAIHYFGGVWGTIQSLCKLSDSCCRLCLVPRPWGKATTKTARREISLRPCLHQPRWKLSVSTLFSAQFIHCLVGNLRLNWSRVSEVCLQSRSCLTQMPCEWFVCELERARCG